MQDIVSWFILSAHDNIDNEYLEEFNTSLVSIMSNRNACVIIVGGFNCGAIE